MASLSRRKFLSLLSLLSTAGCGGGSSGSPGPDASTSATQTRPLDSNGGTTPAPGSVDGKNVIERENAKTAGVSTDWQIADENHAGEREIEGYASATSVRRGQAIRLYVSTSAPSYSISVYRIGWYGGHGGRLVAGPIQRNGVLQPPPFRDPATNMVECNWQDPYVLNIPDNTADPTDWASGVYLAKLTAAGSGKQSYIVFTVRDDMRDAALLFQSGVTTYAAYNNWGGRDFYEVDCKDGLPAYKLSFNRPYWNPQRPNAGKGAGDFLTWELPMLRFLEREGYDAVYATNIDVHTNPNLLTKYRGILSVGHDEYWTKAMRDALENARNKGVHLGFFGANAGYWQIRLEADSSGQPNRSVVCYKYAARDRDPMYTSQPQLTTCVWREAVDPPINRPEAALIGVMYDYNSVDLDMVMADCSSWICTGTNLHQGSVLRGMLGYEVDRVDPLSSPANIQILAASPYTVCNDSTCGQTEIRYANMTYYTATSGAGVFATGSMQWNWGLDAFGPWGDRVNPAVQQMTRNVLNRFAGR